METIVCYTSGSSRGNPGPAGIGVQVLNKKHEVIGEVAEFIGNATDSTAEYTAVARCLEGLRRKFENATKDMAFELRLSSELVQKQLSAQSEVNDARLVPLFIEVHNQQVVDFPCVKFVCVPQTESKEALRLANEAIDEGTKRS